MRVRTERWPLVFFEFDGVTPTRGLALELTEIIDHLFDRREPFAVVMDLTGTGLPDAEARRILAQYQSDRAEEFARYVIADARVVGSPFLRAIYWISPPAARVFKSRVEAEAWCVKALHETQRALELATG